MRITRLKLSAAPLAILMAVCLAGLVAGCGGLISDIDLFPSGSGQETATDSAAVGSGLGVVAVRDLPPEAVTTLHLIESNGPFPYAQDGSVFHNYEGILPKKAAGYYHEYTVGTPGSPDRGARRIVAGENGESYYTDDHYNSFRRVVE